MKVLFSPVGKADPMTELGDGPMLHIVRYERPDKVVLYLSPDMAKIQRKTKCYTKAIKLLAKSLGTDVPLIETIESERDEVHRFDIYIAEFESHLKRLAADGNEVVVNVSSGTPGMCQALVAIGSFGRIGIRMLQVSGGPKHVKRPDFTKVKIKKFWKVCQKAEAKGKCRATEVCTPNFNHRLMCENVKALIRDFDYGAAYEMIADEHSISDHAKELIKGAEARLTLDQNVAAQTFGFARIGRKDLSYKSQAPILEYLYAMEVRLKQRHYAEFMRSLTPALTELMHMALQAYLPDEKYCRYNENGSPCFYERAIEQDSELMELLGDRYKSKGINKPTFIQNYNYYRLVVHYCDNQDLKNKFRALRYAESESRNQLAHMLTKSSKESIEKSCEMELQAIMDMLYEAYDIVKANSDALKNVPAEPGLYNRINELIESKL